MASLVVIGSKSDNLNETDIEDMVKDSSVILKNIDRKYEVTIHPLKKSRRIKPKWNSEDVKEMGKSQLTGDTIITLSREERNSIELRDAYEQCCALFS